MQYRVEVDTLTSSDMFAGPVVPAFAAVCATIYAAYLRLLPCASSGNKTLAPASALACGQLPSIWSSLPLVMFGRLAVAHDGELRARLASRSTDDLAQDCPELLRRELTLGCELRIWREGWAAVSPPREYFTHFFALIHARKRGGRPHACFLRAGCSENIYDVYFYLH